MKILRPFLLVVTFAILSHSIVDAMDMHSINTEFNFVTYTDSYLEQLTHQQEFSGCVLVALNDEVIFRKGYGLARQGIENTPNTRFCIGSITKSFTALLILQLAQEGKLDLDDPVQKYIPEFKHAHVTIHHVLTMTSGLPSDFWTPENATSMVPQKNEWDIEYLIDEKNNKESLQKSCCVDLLFTPGEKFEYSNIGYLLLADIIKRTDDCHSYEQSLQNRIFAPLGMKNTSAASLQKDFNFACSVGKPMAVLADGYGHSFDHGLVHGAGSIVSTIDDVYIWSKCIHEGILLNPEFDKKMKQPSSCEIYACGLVVEDKNEKSVIWHNGGISCFNSNMTIHHYNNEQNDVLTIIVLANKREIADKVAKDVSSIFEKQEKPSLQLLTDTTVNDIESDYEGLYIQDTQSEQCGEESQGEQVTIKIGNQNTLWMCQKIDHFRLLKRTKKDCFGSNILSNKFTFSRDHGNHVVGFTVVDSKDGETLHFIKENHL